MMRLRVQAIRLRAIRTRKRIMPPLLGFFLKLLFLVLLPVMSVDEVSAGDYLKAAEDHDVTLDSLAKDGVVELWRVEYRVGTGFC
jgi:hypothetical protein